MKFNVKKTKSVSLRVSESEEVTLGNGNIDHVDIFIYLCSIISKEVGAVRCSKQNSLGPGCFSTFEKSLEEQKDKSANKD